MLDSKNKGNIDETDVYNMMTSLFELWNIMTDSQVIVLPGYVKNVFKHLDKDNDGKINL